MGGRELSQPSPAQPSPAKAKVVGGVRRKTTRKSCHVCKGHYGRGAALAVLLGLPGAASGLKIAVEGQRGPKKTKTIMGPEALFLAEEGDALAKANVQPVRLAEESDSSFTAARFDELGNYITQYLGVIHLGKYGRV